MCAEISLAPTYVKDQPNINFYKVLSIISWARAAIKLLSHTDNTDRHFFKNSS